MDALRHSVVPPSDVASRARGTQTVTAPNVPIRLRSRWPWRWPDTADRAASSPEPVSGVLRRAVLREQGWREGEAVTAISDGDPAWPALVHSATGGPVEHILDWFRAT